MLTVTVPIATLTSTVSIQPFYIVVNESTIVKHVEQAFKSNIQINHNNYYHT